MKRGVLAFAVATGAVVWACRPIPGPTDGVISISEVELAAPAVVAGDTMRDSTGSAVPLRVYAFGPGGATDTVTGVPAQFFVLDSGAHVSPDGYLIGDSVRSTPVRVVGSLAGLQTPPANVYVIPLPDSLAPAESTTVAPVTFDVLDSAATANYSAGLSVMVLSADTPPQRVQQVIVRYTIVSAPAGRNGATTGVLVSAGGRAGSADTTDVSGQVSMQIRVRPMALATPSVADSFVVDAEMDYGGVRLRGSPVQFVVPIQPPGPSGQRVRGSGIP